LLPKLKTIHSILVNISLYQIFLIVFRYLLSFTFLWEVTFLTFQKTLTTLIRSLWDRKLARSKLEPNHKIFCILIVFLKLSKLLTFVFEILWLKWNNSSCPDYKTLFKLLVLRSWCWHQLNWFCRWYFFWEPSRFSLSAWTIEFWLKFDDSNTQKNYFQRNRVACIVWYFFTFILVGLTLIGNVRNVLSAKANSGTVVSFLICGLEAYFLWVVFAFTRELKQDEENPNSQITTFN